jgi:hypothetical protein
MSRRIVLVLVSSLLGACVSVPRSDRDDGDSALDASWPDQADGDGGAIRPPVGPAYVGPECDPASPSPRGGAGEAALEAARDGGAGRTDAHVRETPNGARDAGDRGVDGGDAAPAVRHPGEGEIVITEIMSDPAAVADTAGEWFELHNPSASEALDLGGCSVDDGAAKPHVVPAPFVIAKDEYVVIGRGAAAGFTPDLVMSFSLGNSADVLVVRCDGREIDRVAYGAGFPLVAGASMSLAPDASASDNDAAGAWCAAQREYAGDRGTPGAANPACADALDADAGLD